MPKTQLRIVFKRSKPFTTFAASGRIWDSKCGLYRIRETFLIGEQTPVYYAQPYVDGRWEVAGRHKTRKAAVRTLEKIAREAARNRQRLLAFDAPKRRRRAK
jgi:hypothetical protein